MGVSGKTRTSSMSKEVSYGDSMTVGLLPLSETVHIETFLVVVTTED